jgi:hypothetical protein
MLKENKRLLLLTLCLLFTTSSCTVISKDINKQTTLKDKSFELERTSISNVLEQLGPPSKLSKLNGGLVFIYESVDIDEYQIGFSAKYDFFRWFKFSFAKGKADRELLLLIFDNNGLLVAKTYNNFEENLGSGQAVSFLYSIDSLVDSSKLEEAPGSLAWGNSLLQPLPIALNYPNNLSTGESGVEQLGAPNSVGQHSLELSE